MMIWFDKKHFSFLDLDFQNYGIKNKQLTVEKGFLNKSKQTIPFYKMTTADIDRSWLQRIFGLCTITIRIENSPDVKLKNIYYDGGDTYTELTCQIQHEFYKNFMAYRQLQMYDCMPYSGAYIDCNDEEYDD